MKSIIVTFLVLLGCSFTLGCPTCPTQPTPAPSPSTPTYVPSNSTVKLPCPKPSPRCPKDWGYSTADMWGSMCDAWATCSSGTHQSPVDIYTPGPHSSHTPSSYLNNGHHYNDIKQSSPFNFNYSPYEGRLFNTGNFFALTGSDDNTFDYNGVLYFLSRVEFHSPSEHTINGYRYDLEVQLIHESGIAGSKSLAVSIFFDRGDKQVNCSQTNMFLEGLQYNLPQFSRPRCSPTEWNGKFDCCVTPCDLPVCGNGILERGEQCDDGKNNSDTLAGACRSNCFKAACGDTITDPFEQCDDGNFVNGDGCSSTCRSECGNGRVNAALEQCDNGAANSDTAPNACRSNCRTAYCGDGVIDNGEECDNTTAGNGINPGQCRSDCKRPRCGDGIWDPTEQCDLGAQNGPGSTCTSTCTSLCGDSTVQAGEDCDYGTGNNNSPNSLCRTNCKAPRCGDGIIDTALGEQCDNGGRPDRYCTADCKQLCGNGRRDAGEECDYGCSNSFAPNSCRPDCTNPICGDGILDEGEECDNGRENSNSRPGACRTNCTIPKCGDSVVDPGEQCDNGANSPRSGCNKCHSECGNGILDAGEECDFGALNSNTTADACRTDCRFPRCGDGVLDSLESCDDGPKNGANPDTCRTDCSLPYCGDGIVDKAHGEYCDEGEDNSDLDHNGCSSNCLPNLCRQSANDQKVQVDLNKALPKNQNVAFAYEGSMTHPPCTEGTQWIIFPEIQFISQRQFDAFTASPFGYNASSRPLQQLGWSRKIRSPFHADEPVCGDGFVQGNEQCDLGWLRNSDNTANLCRKDCTNPRCGDGVTDASEECDDVHETDRCTSTCTLKTLRFNPFVCPSWSYSETCKWSNLCADWQTCDGTRNNARQSPINFDLSPERLSSLGRGKFSLPAQYSTTPISLINTGRSVSLIVGNGQSFLRINATTYTLNRVDFHSPSEHTINGEHATLEAQFIHTSTSGQTVAVSVLYNKAKGHGLVRNSFLDQFWLFLPRDSDCRCGNGVVDPNEQCDNGDMNSDYKQDHCRENCQKPRCGDGVVDRWEECDDGARNFPGANSCKPGTCKKPFCGDGYVDDGEQCDPLNTPTTCSSTCHLLCGDDNTDANEECDDGGENNDHKPNACRTSCKKAFCGDNVVDEDEECDDGEAGSSKCRDTCKKPVCGDGVVDLHLGEECDGGAGCNRCTKLCGNGVTDAGEACDDGAANSNTDGSCRTDCREPTCGDYIVDASLGEQCDQGPTGSIYCSSLCRILCGNGNQEGTEACDNGEMNSDTTPNACRTTCQRAACGDGVKDFGEQCDLGAENGDSPSSLCRPNCRLPRCGDGITDLQEQCDDGNAVNGDGCTATCLNECGNGRRDGTEECDDGEANSNLPNACRSNCKRPKCGDNVVDRGEECDDGAKNADLPNACRTDCTLPRRGDGIVDDQYGEKCDSTQLNDFSGECSTTNIPNACRTYNAPATRLVDLSLAFDKTSPVLTYEGSSTAPPCSEGWRWFVFQNIQTLDEAQYERLVKYIPQESARGPQPLNGRTFSYTASEDAVCGDGLVEKQEECDEGELNSNSPDNCRRNCKLPACGDGILDAGELCDDGAKNSASGPCGLDCRWAGYEGCAPGNKSCTAPGSTTINVIFANLLSGSKCTGNCPNA